MGAYIGGALQGVASGLGGGSSDGKKKKKDDNGEHNIGKSMEDHPGFYGSTVTSYKRGGKVRKTGLALLHKGERVLTRKQDRKRSRKGA